MSQYSDYVYSSPHYEFERNKLVLINVHDAADSHAGELPGHYYKYPREPLPSAVRS